jgi:hypothetical protein
VPRSKLSDIDRFMQYVEMIPESGCWIWMGALFDDGYGAFKLNGQKRAHRAAYQLFVGEVPTGMFICHRCDTPACVNPAHLFPGSHADNTLDMMRKGRNGIISEKKKGERHHAARLTEDQVRSIRADPRSNQELAPIYGVRWKTIWQVRRRDSWKHI